MNEQVAGSVEKPAQFDAALSLDTPEVRGLFSADGEYSYLYDGPLLRVFAANGESVSQVDFSKLDTSNNGSNSDQLPSITCVAPFNKVNILVGLHDSLHTGHLYLFNVVICKVLRSIAIPYGVTSVETIYNDSDCNTVPYLSSELKAFSGLVACGTKQGHIFLIDMLLDQEVVASPPLQLHRIEVSDEMVLPDRQGLLSSNHKAAAYSLACTENPEYFNYMSTSQQVLHYVTLEDVYISCLKFLPQLGTLCVGYNFGSYQLWNMDPLVLDFSSPVEDGALPVSHFSYQEPENDPRPFCYLWAARCTGIPSASLNDSMQEYVVGAMANISLYQLTFIERTYTTDGATLFKDLAQVGCVLDHQLAPEEDVLTSWVVSFTTLSNIKSLKSQEEDSKLEFLPDDSFMTLISWRVRYTDNTITSHFALFDINRWYNARMPAQIRKWDEYWWYQGWCPYFSQYSFDDAVGDKPCLDLHLDTTTISCYKCPKLRKLERFQFPASLSFQVKLLLPTCHVTLNCSGLQRQALLDVVACGPEAVSQPAEAFKLFHSAGLIDNNTTDTVVQRKGLLTTLLLHTHLEFITSCTLEYAKAEVKGKKGLSVEFIVDWVWERLQNVVYQFDKECAVLYDWSGSGVDTALRQTIISSITQARNIHTVLRQVFLLKQRHQKLELGSTPIEERLAVVETRLLHMGVVWWCVSRGLLPEVREDMKVPSSFSYPCSTLRRSYNNYHSQLLMSETTGNTSPEMMVDLLAKDLGTQLVTMYKLEEGSNRYPPPSIKALVDIFLLDSPLLSKILYFVYTVMDLGCLLDTVLSESLSTNLHNLLATLVPQQDFTNVFSLVLALWSIDHSEFEDVLVTLKQPNACQYLTKHQAHSLLKRLLGQGQAKLALELVSLISTKLTVDDNLLLSIYLASGMLSSAVDCTRNSKSSQELFQKILFTIRTGSELSNLLCLPLTQQEVSCVTEHLGDKGDLDKLVIHLLQMGDLPEAVKLNRKLNSQPLWRGNQKAKEKAMTRDQLVKWQLSFLPAMQKKLLEDPNYIYMSRSKATRHRVYKPGKNFFCRPPQEVKPMEPVEIARVVMESDTTTHTPFIQCLTPRLTRVLSSRKSTLLSAVKDKKGGKSVTGLFDSTSTKSPTKRPSPYTDEEPSSKTAKSETLHDVGVKALLQTPLVNRKLGRTPAVSVSVQATPHSILKTKRAAAAVISPSSMHSPTLQSSSDELTTATGSKSVSRVKFNMEGDDSTVSQMSPKAISFDDEEDVDATVSVSGASVDSQVVERMMDTGDGEVEFDFSAPLVPVLTARRTLGLDQSVASQTSLSGSEESFASADNELSPMSQTAFVSPQALPASNENMEVTRLAQDTGSPKMAVRQTRRAAMDLTRREAATSDSSEQDSSLLKDSKPSAGACPNITLDPSTSTGSHTAKGGISPPSSRTQSRRHRSMAVEKMTQQKLASDSSDQKDSGKSDSKQEKSQEAAAVSPPRKSVRLSSASVASKDSKDITTSSASTAGPSPMDAILPPKMTIHHHSPPGSTPSPKPASKSPKVYHLSKSPTRRSTKASTKSVDATTVLPSTPAQVSTQSLNVSAHTLDVSSSKVSTRSRDGSAQSKDSPKHSPSKTSSSPEGSLRSLNVLDEEARKSGLALRQVREAAILQEHEFMFSPVTSAAPADSLTADPTGQQEFDFTEPLRLKSSRTRAKSGSKQVDTPSKQTREVTTKSPGKRGKPTEPVVGKEKTTVRPTGKDSVSAAKLIVDKEKPAEPAIEKSKTTTTSSAEKEKVIPHLAVTKAKTSGQTTAKDSTATGKRDARIEVLSKASESEEFMFSPVTSAAPADSLTADPTGQQEFDFTEPLRLKSSRTRAKSGSKQVGTPSRQTREISTVEVNKEKAATKSTSGQGNPTEPAVEKEKTTGKDSVLTTTQTDEADRPAKSSSEDGEEFHFSSTIAMAASNTKTDTSIAPPTYTFSPPAVVTTTRKSERQKKPVRPIKITLPSSKEKGESSKSSTEGVLEKRNTKPVKPIEINIPDSVFRDPKPTRATRSKAAVQPTEPAAPVEPAVVDPPQKPTTSATTQSSEESAPPATPPRRGRSRTPSSSAQIAEESILAGHFTAVKPATRRRTRQTSESSTASAADVVEKPTPSRKGRTRKNSKSSETDENEAMDIQPAELTTIAEDAPLETGRKLRSRKPAAESVVPEASTSQAVTRATRAKNVSEEPPVAPSRRGRPRKVSESSVTESTDVAEILPASTRGKGRGASQTGTTPSTSTRRTRASSVDAGTEEPSRSTRGSTRKTRLRSAEPEGPAVKLNIKMSETRKASKSPTKLSVKITSPKKTQSARKAVKSVSPKTTTRSRTSVKKPQLSPIASSPSESSTSKPRTRARRKL